MNIQIIKGLPFVSASLKYGSEYITMNNVLLDTGSAGTIFSIDKLITIGLQPESDDPIMEIQGVGGTEFVFIKKIDQLSLGHLKVNNFEIEIGAMDYGMKMDGIIGMNFLLQMKAKIDLHYLNIK
ncbi:Peptidase A2A, retrovirus RVP subgroup [Candidatus Magnetomorum sp. HK-1]|nr:Peptidase A2A, retrovirus RVP subgroup [Candidatus Magnetomorum sp. HK-1]